jgi:hypothetical protein
MRLVLTHPALFPARDLAGAHRDLAAAKTSDERPAFAAHHLYPPHLRRQVEHLAQSFNPNWLLPPQDGEIFDSANTCFQRLQTWAFARGFTIVTTTSGNKKARSARE